MASADGLITLVVEDDDLQRLALARLLLVLGARKVLEAENGSKALALMREVPKVDLIVCDLDMPEMDGMEFMRHLGQARSTASVIINSSMEQALIGSVGKMAQVYGVNLLGLIEKPTTLAKLDELILRYEPHLAPLAPPASTPRLFSLEQILHGLLKNQFQPFFQPKVALASGRLLGAESLARWDHPAYGLIYPKVFINVLERHESIDDLTLLMLEKAAQACRDWLKHRDDLTVSVNLSLVSLSDTTVADKITQIVRSTGIEPRHMMLEITETAVMAEVGPALENLTRLRMRGFGLSIDDFGTGFSSLQQLGRVPFTELKIDQSLVAGCGTTPSSRAIIESSVALARSLNLKSIAEGVETQADWDFLQAAGCDAGQGYFIANPMDADFFMDCWVTKT